MQKRIENRYLLGICVVSILLSCIAKQSRAQDSTSGYPHYNVFITPGGFFDTVLDRLGNKYPLFSIAVNDTLRGHDGGIVSNKISTCSSGYFQLFFEPGSELENDTDASDIARRAVICRVLYDLSKFIHSPLTDSGNKINVWIRNSANVHGASGLGYATSFFAVPNRSSISGIADNVAWTTIHAGRDAYLNLAPHSAFPASTAGTCFHVIAAFNFDDYSWHTDLSSPPGMTEFDMYTVVLREMAHALGLASEIAADGSSLLGSDYPYYSRYDQNLRSHSGVALLSHSGSVSMYTYGFNSGLSASNILSPYPSYCVTDSSDCDTAAQYNGGVTLPVYNPNCYEAGFSLSSFEDECTGGLTDNNKYFTVSNATNPGGMKRYLKSEERIAMCDIGYVVDSAYGDSSNLNFYDYGTSTCGTINVAGINDGFASNGSYCYVSSIVGTIQINGTGLPTGCSGLLANDMNADSFEGLRMIDGTGSFNVTSGSSSTPVIYSPGAGEGLGIKTLSYVPVNTASGKRGNITYARLFVTFDTLCPPDNCNFVVNGEFSTGVNCGSVYSGVNSTFDTASLCSWMPWINTYDLYSHGCTTEVSGYYTAGVPTINGSTMVYDYLGSTGNFIGLWGGYAGLLCDSIGYQGEAVQTELASQLIPGNHYVLKCKALVSYYFLFEINNQHLKFYINDAPFPILPSIGSSCTWNSTAYSTAVFGSYYPIDDAGSVDWNLVTAAGVGNWQTIAVPFVYTGPAAIDSMHPQYLGIVNASFLNSDGISHIYKDYMYLDAVSITPQFLTVTATSTNICIGDSTTITVTGGTPPYTWSTGATGNTIRVAPNHTTDYTVTDSSGCPGGAITIHVNFRAVPITGTRRICGIGSTTALTDSVEGGTWTSSDTSKATVDSLTGIVTAVASGTVIITYTVVSICGTTFDTAIIYISPALTITATSVNICLGDYTTIVVTGGTAPYTWTPGGVAGSLYVDPVVSTNYSVIDSIGCTDAIAIYVSPRARIITGAHDMCGYGTTLALYDSTYYGTWTSSNTAVATVAAYGLDGIVTAVSAGTVIITYTIVSACGTTSDTAQIHVAESPTITASSDTICFGNYTNLTATGGIPPYTWSTTATGTFIYVDPATTTLYTVTDSSGCSSNNLVNVLYLAKIITGAHDICGLDWTLPLADSTPGGVWTSSNTSVATVNPSTGVVTSISAGTAIITYSVTNVCGTSSDTALIHVFDAPISGPTSVCAGDTIYLTDATVGGIWTTLVTIIHVDSFTGAVRAYSGPTATVFYTIGSCYAEYTITITARPNTITGVSDVCVGSMATFVETSTGGTWSSSNTAIATVSSTGGVITGVSAGTATITYTNSTTGCYNWRNITVRALPAAISGSSGVCEGSAITLTDATSGGTWSSSTTTIATVGSTSGIVHGISPGLDTIKYTSTSTGCSIRKLIRIDTMPIAGVISGADTVCADSTIALAYSSSGGTWSSSDNSKATVDSTGLVTGVSAGSVFISYTVANSCGTVYATKSITVNPLPFAGTISGTGTVCAGSSITLTDTASGGTWSISNNTIASINSSGLVTAISAGNDTVYYTVINSCGTAITMFIITVNPLPHVGDITGTATVCAGSQITLSDTVAGGSWSSHFTAIATVNASGVVTGVAAGIDTIIYSVTNMCGTALAKFVVTVNPLPDSGVITGTDSVCVGAIITLSETVAGGVWAINNISAATITYSGVVTGLLAGADTIIYSVTNGCGTGRAFFTISVKALPNAGIISGTTTVCPGATTTLSSDSSGGTWTSINNSIATVNSSGVVTGVANGTDSIFYSVTNSCGTAIDTATITVSSSPYAGTITGPSTVCYEASITLSDAVTGGSWTSSNSSVATVSSSGVVTGTSSYSATISYSVTNSCGTASATLVVSVLTLSDPGTITGDTSVCSGSSITLSESVAGGSWTSGNTLIATVTGSGVVSASNPGADTIYYSVTGTCGTMSTLLPIQVNPLPAPITGTTSLCLGTTTTLGDSTPGGTWSSSDTSIAAIDPSTGFVSGISAGTVTITYASSTSGCFVTTSVAIHPLPVISLISGSDSLCVGTTSVFADATAGGTWTSSATSVATIDAGGVVTAVTAGTTLISYTVIDGFGCNASVEETVAIIDVPVVFPIAPASVCVGNSVPLIELLVGGMWSSGDISIGTVDPFGNVTGVAPGVVSITYNYTASICTGYASADVTVYALPSAGVITGPDSVCVGSVIMLSDTAIGFGLWSSSDDGIATVDFVGNVYGGAVGAVVISYTLSDSHCSNIATDSVYVIDVPAVPGISGLDTLCLGGTDTLLNAMSGGSWSSYDPGTATVDPVTGVVTGVNIGAVTIAYDVSNMCGTSEVTFDVMVVPSHLPITGVGGVCSGDSTILTDGVPGGTWTSSDTSIAVVDPSSGVVTGISSGTATISYTVSGMCGTFTDTIPVTVNMIPYISTNFIVACQSLLTTGGDGGGWSHGTIISDSTGCLLVCDSSVARYYAHGVFGSSFTWSVVGGTPTVYASNDSIDVFWPTAGTVGSITHVDSFSHCIGQATACIRVIQKPHANFSVSESSVCLGDAISFFNHSTADSTSLITAQFWDFGDGTASTAPNPTHTYTVGGMSYTVTLIVRNACNCTDTFRVVVNVERTPGPVINCPSIACQNESDQYSVSPVCSPLWSVIGGTITSPLGLGTITVKWDHVDSTGFGYVSVANMCDTCSDTTTIKIPVILDSALIAGPDVICANQQYMYSIPLWPATSYEWGVLGAPGTIFGYNNDYQVVVNFPTPGTYTIHAWYQNKLKLCGGNVTKTITVLPPISISGSRSVCNGSTEIYALPGAYSGNWTVTDPSNSVTTYTPGNSVSISFSMPGAYLISASGDFCAPPLTVNVLPLPPAIDSITGKDTVCLNRVYTYQAFHTVAGAIYNWQAIGGTVLPASGNDIVDVVWTSGGTKQLIVNRISVVDTPHCPGPDTVINIIQEIVNPVVTGDTIPCSDGHRTYGTTYNRGEAYLWSIFPDSLGSVVGGIHSTSINVLWNTVTSPTTASVILRVNKCDSIYYDTLSVIIQPIPTVTITPDASTVCPGTTVTFTATVGGSSYFWQFGDGISTVTTTNVTTHRFPHNVTPGNVYYHVLVSVTPDTLIACPVSGSGNFTITLLPGPVAYATTPGPTNLCPGIPRDIIGTVTDNVGSLAYQWFNAGGTIGGATNPIYHNYYAGSFYFVVVAGNGCTDTSNHVVFQIFCDTAGHAYADSITSSGLSGTSCGDIIAHAADTCAHVTLTGTPGTSMTWIAEVAPVNITGYGWTGNVHTGSSTVLAYYDTLPGIYRFKYICTLSGGCTDSVSVIDTIKIIPNYRYAFRCAPGNFDTLLLTDNSVYLPWVHIDSIHWYGGGGTGYAFLTGVSPTIVVPMDTDIGFTEYVYYSWPGGHTSCGRPYNFIAPGKPHAAFTFATDSLCETIPVSFTPAGSIGSIIGYRWAFGNGGINLLTNPQCTYDWQSPNVMHSFHAALTVSDNIGCKDTANKDVHVRENLLSGSMNFDSTICANAVPFNVDYINSFSSGASTPISYLWSTGTTSTVPYIEVYSTGAYHVTVFDIYQCQQPIFPAENVKLLRVPHAQIYGRQDYCVGDQVVLSGYAGPAVSYEWSRDGTNISTNPDVFDPIAGTTAGDYLYQLTISVLDTPSGTICTDIATLIVHVHSLPDPPSIIGPTVIDCGMYHMQLVASESQPGTYNWSDGNIGDTDNVYTGGPYRVWFTDNNGCRVSADTYVPLSPEYYFQYFPSGCYTICNEQLPLTLNGPPNVWFNNWDWLDNTTDTVSSGIGIMASYAIDSAGNYQWMIDNGLCADTSAVMGLSLTKCGPCDKVICTASFVCDSSNPASYMATITIYDAGLGSYTLGTDIGPVYPFSGILTTPTTTLSLTFTTLDTLATSVTLYVEITDDAGNKCFKSIKVNLDACHWIAERNADGNHTKSGGDNLKASNAMMVYPNPASGELNISFDYGTGSYTEKSISVFDQLGRRASWIPIQDNHGNLVLNTSDWMPGIYIIRMEGDGSPLQTQRVVVSH